MSHILSCIVRRQSAALVSLCDSCGLYYQSMPVGLERNANSCKTCIRGDDCCSISGLVVALLTPCSPSPLPFLPEPRSRAQGSGISSCVVNATALRLHYCLELLGMRWDPALSCGLLTCSGYFGRSSAVGKQKAVNGGRCAGAGRKVRVASSTTTTADADADCHGLAVCGKIRTTQQVAIILRALLQPQCRHSLPRNRARMQQAMQFGTSKSADSPNPNSPKTPNLWGVNQPTSTNSTAWCTSVQHVRYELILLLFVSTLPDLSCSICRSRGTMNVMWCEVRQVGASSKGAR